MKTLGIVIFLISPWVMAQSGVATNIESLSNLLAEKNILVSSQPDEILAGKVKVVLSQGPWPESAVQSFKQKNTYAPTVLTLTAPQLGSIDGSSLVITNPQDVFYLYIDLPANTSNGDELVTALKTLLDDDFQTRLQQAGFISLPNAYKRVWQVKLGMALPQFRNGYL